jgi:adenylate kinase
MYRSILLFGSPGSGKGTQGKILGAIPGFYHCACGDVFRSLRVGDPLGKVFVDYSSRGLLVPDAPTIDLWSHYIQAKANDGQFHPGSDVLVLDGIPRNPDQAGLLKDTLEVKAVINLSCPDPAKMIERLQRRALHENRLDDANLEVIRKRLDTYERDTRPMLDYYGPKLVREVDAAQPPLGVLRDILDILVKLV